MSRTVEEAYDAVRTGSLPVEHLRPGVLTARGTSTFDFLHRMSTNDLESPAEGQVRGTVLTTAIGRTVDAIEVVRRHDDALLITSHGRADDVRAWLTRHVFFNDDVEIVAAEGAYHLWGLFGQGAGAEVTRLLGVAPPPLATAVTVDGGLVWGVDRPARGYRFLLSAPLQERAREQWGESGEGTPRWQAFEALRIESGIPAAGRDFDQETIPLEAGLWDLVHFDKGCYIGQEVIARMESRSRLARRLMGASLSQPAPPPQDVVFRGSAVGRLTSTAVSPRLGPIGLGIVKSSVADQAPIEVRLAPAEIRATLLPLPLATPPS